MTLRRLLWIRSDRNKSFGIRVPISVENSLRLCEIAAVATPAGPSRGEFGLSRVAASSESTAVRTRWRRVCALCTSKSTPTTGTIHLLKRSASRLPSLSGSVSDSARVISAISKSKGIAEVSLDARS